MPPATVVVVPSNARRGRWKRKARPARGTLGCDTEPESTALQSIQPAASLAPTTQCVSHQLAAIERHVPGDKLGGPRRALALLRSSDACLQKSHFLQRLLVKGGQTQGREGGAREQDEVSVGTSPELLCTATATASHIGGTHTDSQTRRHPSVSPTHPEEPPLTLSPNMIPRHRRPSRTANPLFNHLCSRPASRQSRAREYPLTSVCALPLETAATAPAI